MEPAITSNTGLYADIEHVYNEEVTEEYMKKWENKHLLLSSLRITNT